MCNLSEGIWEKAVAKGRAEGMAEAMAEGEKDLLIRIITNLMAKGMDFEEALNFIDVTPENINEIKERVNKK